MLLYAVLPSLRLRGLIDSVPGLEGGVGDGVSLIRDGADERMRSHLAAPG